MDKVARDVHEWMEMHGEPTAADRFRENVVYLRMNVSNTHSYIGETANWTQRVQRHAYATFFSCRPAPMSS